MVNLFKKINSHNPDYVFILGDSKLHEVENFKNSKIKLMQKYIFGNHEVKI